VIRFFNFTNVSVIACAVLVVYPNFTSNKLVQKKSGLISMSKEGEIYKFLLKVKAVCCWYSCIMLLNCSSVNKKTDTLILQIKTPTVAYTVKAVG
jgi:hypothetical protein